MAASRLGLTDDQIAQIRAVAQSHRAEWRAADPIDEAGIRQRSAEMAAVEADIAVARAHARAENFKVLTPEQQAQAKALRRPTL